jgi:hypothetical protein
LDFTVYNIPQDIGNPEGLRVEVSGTYVPEPGFYGVLALGMIGLLLALPRRGPGCIPVAIERLYEKVLAV